MFRTARETLRNSLSRMRNRQFLDATMAATALVATADGDVTFSELSALDNVLDSIQDLQIYDPHVAVDIIAILPMRSPKTRNRGGTPHSPPHRKSWATTMPQS